MWGVLLVLALPSVLLMADRVVRARRGVRHPGRRQGRLGARSGGRPGRRTDADRGLPARAVRHRRDDGLPGRDRHGHAVRRARGALAAAVPAVRAGPPAPADLAGSGRQVLPARRLHLGDLRLRAGAALRVLGLHRVRRRSPRQARAGDSSDVLLLGGLALVRGRPAVQGLRRTVPPVDARRLPGRADPGHRVHGVLHQGRRVRRDAAGLPGGARADDAGPGSRWSG